MLLSVGHHTFDLASRALVVGQVDVSGEPLAVVCDRVAGAVGDGADLVEVAGLDDHGFAAAQTSIGAPPLVRLVTAHTVEEARQAGSPDQVVLAVDDLRGVAALAGTDYPVLATTDDPGAAAVAVVLGCRLVRTTAVGAVRRVCDVLAAVMKATG